MERTSPNYNDPNFNMKPEDTLMDKYEQGIDKAFNAADKVYSAGRKIGYIFMALFFFLIGGGLTVWGIFNYSSRLDELDSFEKTNGTVVRMREVPETDNSGVTYAPVISFTDGNSKKYEFESKNSSDPPAYEVGEKVPMRYDKNNPNDAFIDSFWGKWTGTMVILTFPLVLFPLGLWMLISAFRRNKSVNQTNYSQKNSGSYISIG